MATATWVTVHNRRDAPVVIDAAGHHIDGGAYGSVDTSTREAAAAITRVDLLIIVDPGNLTGLAPEVVAAINATRANNGTPNPAPPPPAAGPSLRPRGTYAGGIPYNASDVVTYFGVPFICLTAHTSVDAFDWSKWMRLGGAGTILASAAKGSYTLPNVTGFQDVPGMMLTVPAGFPFTLKFLATIAFNQGSLAAGVTFNCQFRVVDVATGLAVYLFADPANQFASAANSGAFQTFAYNKEIDWPGQPTPTSLKLQSLFNAAGAGNCNLFDEFGNVPTVLKAVAA